MKIYNTSCFEKLKIRPVDVNKLSTNNFIVRRVEPSSIKYRDIEIGTICRMNEEKTTSSSNIWVCVGVDKMNLFFNGSFNCGGFVTPTTENEVGLDRILISEYEAHWPYHILEHDFNIADVWLTTNEFYKDLYAVESVQEFVFFYNKYNLKDL